MLPARGSLACFDLRADCLVDECGIVTGLATYKNITAGLSQNKADQPSLLVQGQPYCATSLFNSPINGGTYMMSYQWTQCACDTLRDGTFLSICNSKQQSNIP